MESSKQNDIYETLNVETLAKEIRKFLEEKRLCDAEYTYLDLLINMLQDYSILLEYAAKSGDQKLLAFLSKMGTYTRTAQYANWIKDSIELG
jgi:hypothetical protein